jgi:glycosyltransferase involved in cell wall biosynthesis
VQSALAQTLTDLEVVIVDNQSTDETWPICERLARSDARVRIFRNDSNIGPVRNWQRCIREGRGDLGKILFSDDLITPLFLEKTVPFMEDPKVGLVTTAADISGRIEYMRGGSSGVVSSRKHLWHMMFNGRLPCSPGAALFRMKDLRKNLIDFGADGIGPDLLLLMLTAKAYSKAAHLAEPLAFFRTHPGSISRQTQAQLASGYAWARMRFIFSFIRTMQT